MELLLNTEEERSAAAGAITAIFKLVKDCSFDDITELMLSIFGTLKPESWNKDLKRQQNYEYIMGASRDVKQSDVRFPPGRYYDREKKLFKSERKVGKTMQNVVFYYFNVDGSLVNVSLNQILQSLAEVIGSEKDYNKMLKAMAKMIARDFDVKVFVKHRSIHSTVKKNEYVLSSESPYLNIGTNYPASISGYIKPTLLGPLKNLIDVFEYLPRAKKDHPPAIVDKVKAIKSAMPKMASLFNDVRPTLSYKQMKGTMGTLAKALGTTSIMTQYPTVIAAFTNYHAGGSFGASMDTIIRNCQAMPTFVSYGIEANVMSVLTTEAMMGTIGMDDGIRMQTTGVLKHLAPINFDNNAYWFKPALVKGTCWAGPTKGGRQGTSQVTGMNMGVQGIHASRDTAVQGFESYKRMKMAEYGYGQDENSSIINAIQRMSAEGFQGTSIDGKTVTYQLRHTYVRTHMIGNKVDDASAGKKGRWARLRAVKKTGPGTPRTPGPPPTPMNEEPSG